VLELKGKQESERTFVGVTKALRGRKFTAYSPDHVELKFSPSGGSVTYDWRDPLRNTSGSGVLSRFNNDVPTDYCTAQTPQATDADIFDAADACGLKAVPSTDLGQTGSGYDGVNVRFSIPNTEHRVALTASDTALINFSITMPGASVPHQDGKWVKAVAICTEDRTSPTGKFYSKGTVWFRVRASVDKVLESTIEFSAKLIIPSHIVRSKPLAGTTLNTGVHLRGSWSDEGGVPTLSMQPQA
jgi:hypothetical protein